MPAPIITTSGFCIFQVSFVRVDPVSVEGLRDSEPVRSSLSILPAASNSPAGFYSPLSAVRRGCELEVVARFIVASSAVARSAVARSAVASSAVVLKGMATADSQSLKPCREDDLNLEVGGQPTKGDSAGCCSSPGYCSGFSGSGFSGLASCSASCSGFCSVGKTWIPCF